MSLDIAYDANLIAEIAAQFELRDPNREALATLVRSVELGEYDPKEPVVLDLATGVGKTYILAAFIEYVRRQGHTHVMVVTPNKVVQTKTVHDLRRESPRYIGGFEVAPILVTPDDMNQLALTSADIDGQRASTVFVFNVQQLFPPKDGGKNVATGMEQARRKFWLFQEDTGSLAHDLRALDDLVIIADESHLFGTAAKVFRSSLTKLEPALTVGLTASPDKNDNIIYNYPLWLAIEQQYVKQPVLVFRESGYDSDERQLFDMLSILSIKEEAYRHHREAHPEGKQTVPIAFVVCKDVAHATETAEKLRSPRFVGDPTAVLQVDNEHDDLATQALLTNLDAPGSPVRVVVSVNKLREGWDTKRIAVMCTLRAMGSEVLTQQLMGRGLRLPFGAWTGDPTIDQLDILSHESFVKLLNSENVLREFGLEGAIKEGENLIITPPGKKKETDTGTGTETGTGTGTDTDTGTNTTTSGDTGTPTGTETGSSSTVVSRPLDDGDDINDVTPRQEPVMVTRTANYKDVYFHFPTTIVTQTRREFDLKDITRETIARYASQVTDTDDHLDRRAFGTSLEGEGKTMHTEKLPRLAVPSLHQSTRTVTEELIRQTLLTGRVGTDPATRNYLTKYVVPAFMEATRIDQWTEKAKQSAVSKLARMIADERAQAGKHVHEDIKVTPVRLPIHDTYPLPYGEKIHGTDIDSSKDFTPRAHYGTWTQGLHTAAAFDSFSAEFRLASLIDLDPTVSWWKRIYSDDGAKVSYTPHNHYIPDFVIRDTDGVFWIVEAKDARGRDDETVQAKKKAAERTVRTLTITEGFSDQRWGYIICYEDDIARADSLADLIANAGAVEVTPA